MENTVRNIGYFISSSDPQIKAAPTNKLNQSDIVFFIVDVNELFGITLDYPGIIGALNNAFLDSKQYIPVATGLTKRSYTMEKINETQVRIYFDPKKIIGQVRKGVTVKEYYVVYIAQNAKRFNWLSIVMKHFYDRLYKEVKDIGKKHPNKPIDPTNYLAFIAFFNADYEQKKEEAKQLKKDQEQQEKQRKQYIAKIKKKIGGT